MEEKTRLQKAMEGFLAAIDELDSALDDATHSSDGELADLAGQTMDRLNDAHDYESVGDEVKMGLDFLKKL